MNKVALFDFCETLANFQTADAYVDYVRNHCGKLSVKFYKLIHTILAKTRIICLLSILFPKRSINKRIYALQLSGFSLYDLDIMGKEYYENVVRPNLIYEVIKELKRLQERKYRIILVSGGYCFYLKYFAIEYGIAENDIICTSFAFSNGKCTGTFHGKDCLFEEKVKRLDVKIKKYQNDSVAFSDSLSDLPMLEWAGEGVVVRKRNKKKWNSKYKEILWGN